VLAPKLWPGSLSSGRTGERGAIAVFFQLEAHRDVWGPVSQCPTSGLLVPGATIAV
jgi:hypothetical protein